MATVAAPMIVPATVFGRNAPSNRVNLGAIGVGGQGYHSCIRNFAPLEDVRIVAAADCFTSRRRHFANVYNSHYGEGICTPYADYREILERDDVDGVVISTPDHWHVHMAMAAALAGKDMYVEKPLSVAMSWAWKLREVFAEREVIFQYGTQQRSMRSSQLAVDLVRNGYVGEIQRVDVWSPSLDGPTWGDPTPVAVPEDLDYDRWLGPALYKPYAHDRCTSMGTWHIYNHALGMISVWGAHPLDLLQWGLDTDHTSPVSYEGSGRIAHGGLADTSYAWDIHCEYACGLPVRYMSREVARPVVREYHPAFREDGTTFFGTEGWVSVSRGACYMNLKGRMVNTSHVRFKPEDKRVYNGDSHSQNFVNCMKSREQTVNPLEAAIRSDTISHCSDIAIRTGRKIHWDPDSERIVDDDEASKLLDRPIREGYPMPGAVA